MPTYENVRGRYVERVAHALNGLEQTLSSTFPTLIDVGPGGAAVPPT